MDDIGGFVAAWEAVRLMKSLGIVPKRTIRVVGWVAEENSGAGANQVFFCLVLLLFRCSCCFVLVVDWLLKIVEFL